jgi:DHA1 family multidrug resistance protein-like MFS transporter
VSLLAPAVSYCKLIRHRFIVYAASAIYIIGIPGIMLEHGIGEQEALLGLSLYVLACKSHISANARQTTDATFIDGLGPMLWAPLSELEFIGRGPIYATTFIAFVVFSTLAATTHSWGSFLGVRFLQGFFGSPCLAIGGASMHDLFPTQTVPYYLAVWVAAAYCGPALGPLLASYLVPARGWTWGMWEIVWLAAPTIMLMLTLPETHGPTIKAQQASRSKRGLAQNDEKLPGDRHASARLILETLRDAVIRPVQITLLDPAVTVANLYTAFMYGTYYTFFDALPRVYPELYGFTTGQLGFVFLCIFVACVVGGAAYSLYIHRISLAGGQEHCASHEIALRPALVASTLPPIGLFLFGWTSDGDIHWIVSIIGITIYAAGTFVILQCLGVYLPRIYPAYSASLFAANDLCRSLVATAAIHIGVPLYGKLGIAHGVSILGAMSVLGIPGMWFIYYKGPALRAQSRFMVPASS